MKLSIVSAYHNRKEFFIKTLDSISKTKHKDFEFIVVDDCSDEEHRLEDILEKYSFLKLIRLEKKDRWYVNPCIPFNVGFSKASGDIIMLQNPECYHTSDIISYTVKNLKENDYFSFGCFSLDENKTKKFLLNDFENYETFLVDRPVNGTSSDGWFNHSEYRHVGYHFTSAIYKEKLINLGGFDEKFANGIGYDDDEFLRRVKKVCNFKIIDNPFVFHQWHYNYENFDKERHDYLVNINKKLFFNIK